MANGASEQLGDYRLVEKLGEGGHGVVWKAVDLNLDREVAVKILPDAFSADASQVERFEREAKLLASLSHPNIATIYGFHSHEGRRFLAMELIPGEDLARLLKSRELSIAESLAIARQIASALEATHERGVIHRDLKPANVYVMPDGGVKVLDFGIARGIERAVTSATEGPERTEPGTIVGTVSYMSPEQARGQTLDVTTDLWSFGCVLYRMLRGRPAFDGKTRWDRLAAVLRSEPDWEALPPETPPSVVTLLRRCLDRDRDKRLADASEARKTLETELARQVSESAPHLGASFGGHHAPARARAAAVIIGLVFVAIVVVLSLRGLVGRNLEGPAADVAPGDASAEVAVAAPPERSVAVLPFDSAGDADDLAFAAGIHDDILNRLAKVSELRVTSRTSVMELDRKGKSLGEIAEELGVTTVLEGGARRDGDEVRVNVRLIEATTERPLWSANYDRDLSKSGIFAIQGAIAESVASALEATLTPDEREWIDDEPTRNIAAYDAYVEGLEQLHRPGDLEEDLLAARRSFRLAIEADPDYVMAYAGLSKAARDHYWLSSGTEEALEEARSAARQAIELDPERPEARLALGTVLYMERQYEQALAELRLAESGLPGNAELKRWKAFLVRRRGGWDEALTELRLAQQINPLDSETVMEVGFTLFCMRRYDEAEIHLTRAVKLAPDYSSARVYHALAPVMPSGDPEGVRRAAAAIDAARPGPWRTAHGWHAWLWLREWEQALRFVSDREVHTGQWFDYPASLLRGWTLVLAGRTQDALAELEDARATLERKTEAHPNDARLRGALGVAYAALGRKDDALREGRRAAELLPLENDRFVGAWQLQDLAWIYTMTGEPEQAIAALGRLLEGPSVWSIETLLLDPRSEPLRDHPDFEALVVRYRRSG